MECLLAKFTATPARDRDIIVEYTLLITELIIIIITFTFTFMHLADH